MGLYHGIINGNLMGLLWDIIILWAYCGIISAIVDGIINGNLMGYYDGDYGL
jgi:large-conductance mechanosensitive channel